ncbi:MAG: DUF1015 domain-containing protein [Ruminococcaceae bacterium]|nr:DUF1015 domain-containing protein [Oscillospiraceae bacterium]
MAVFKPLKAIRPKPEYADKVAALPYDVMNSEEAKEMVKGNPYSFLHVDKAEIDLPEGTYLYSDEVYQKAKENLEKLVTDGICIDDNDAKYYIYRQIMNGRAQTGIVGAASIDDYIEGRIKRHEFTRADKEEDRIRHIDTCDANTGPIFLTYRQKDNISDFIKSYCDNNSPIYDFVSDGVQQTVWEISSKDLISDLEEMLSNVGDYYIADGHHRCASAAKVGMKRREENPDFNGSEEFNLFLAVLFADSDLEIMDYNRVIKDLNGLSAEEFLNKISEKFEVEKQTACEPFKPSEKHTFGLYMEKCWYKLTAKDGIFDESDPVDRLDVSILQNNLISPILGITDPRTDKRIDFVGGIRGLKELEKRAESDMKIAFSMFPTTLDDLMSIADAGKVMPPKSTWFEPKLLSGLFIHKLK